MNLVVLGAANPETARILTAVQRAQPSLKVRGYIDNDPRKRGTVLGGYPVLGGFEILDSLVGDGVHFVNLITGSTTTRYETSLHLAQHGCKFANLVHPSVNLEMSSMGLGNYIQESVVVQAATTIGNNSSISVGSLVNHEVHVGNSVFIAPGCSIAGCVSIGDGTFVGTHATIIPRIRVGKWATIGAGAVVIRDVPDGATVVGNPARKIRQIELPYPSGDMLAGRLW